MVSDDKVSENEEAMGTGSRVNTDPSLFSRQLK